MSPQDIADLSDKDLLAKLEDAVFIDRFENSDDWKLIREACERLAKQAEYELDRTDPIKNPTKIIECQIVKKFCRNMLRGIINSIKAEGKLAFDEAGERDLNLTE